MTEHPQLRFVYLTLPELAIPTLNIYVDGTEHMQFRVTREQLFELNAQIADTLVKGDIKKEHAFDEQLVLSLEKVAKQPA